MAKAKKKVVKKKVTKKDNSLGLGKVERIIGDENQTEISLSEDGTELFVELVKPKEGIMGIVKIVIGITLGCIIGGLLAG